jgi:hypothetical protein
MIMMKFHHQLLRDQKKLRASYVKPTNAKKNPNIIIISSIQDPLMMILINQTHHHQLLEINQNVNNSVMKKYMPNYD